MHQQMHAQRLRLGVVGIAGRMGREIVATAESDSEVRIIGGTVRPGSPASMNPPSGVTIHESLAGLLPLIDVVIDFSTPASSVETARLAAEAGIPAVIGTTGLTTEQMAALRAASARVPIWYARNMSTGIGALLRFLPEIARALEGYDIELIETHHRHKRDAPSGTALALVDAIRSGLANDGEDHPLVHGREGHSPRRPGEIGIHAVRGGGNAGEHEVIFASGEEEIRISHRAYNRGAFAAGAIRAAKRIVTLPPGWHGPG